MAPWNGQAWNGLSFLFEHGMSPPPSLTMELLLLSFLILNSNRSCLQYQTHTRIFKVKWHQCTDHGCKISNGLQHRYYIVIKGLKSQ